MSFYQNEYGFYYIGGGGSSTPDKNIYIAQWDNSVTYLSNPISVVAYQGNFYKSLQNNNLNNNPSSSPLYWEEISGSSGVTPYHSTFVEADWQDDIDGGYFILYPSSTHNQGTNKYIYAFISSDTVVVGEKQPMGYGDFLQYDNGDIKILSDTKFDGFITITKFDAGTINGSNDYNDLANKPILNTESEISLTPTEEEISGTINLHKISKTGNASDVNNDSSVSGTTAKDALNTLNTSKEASGTASSLMTTHEATYNHSDIALNTADRHTHANIVDLNLVSGTNTGNQDLSGLVPKTTTINSKSLSSNITLNASDIGALDLLLKGNINGVAELNGSGQVPYSQLPSLYSTDKYYVDGTLGNDLISDGSEFKPFKTIQACLNYIGQPITMEDAMRHISIYISDSHTAIVGNNSGTNQSWDGVYKENLVVPSRMITMYGAGVKIGNNVYNVDTGFGNILKEYSSSRRFGASSSDLRPCLTFVGLMNCRDSHNRLRNGFHINGNCRTSILKRNFDSIQGDGVNHITVHITSGQNPYIISINPNYPTEPLIRISVSGTTNYNGTYDITTKVNDTTFIATRISGTNTHTEIETSGLFFESDTAGASGVTHDAAFINCYMQGQYTCDDGTVNSAAPTAGTEVLYSVNTRWYTGIEGRTILAQRWEDTTVAGTNILSSISGMFNCSFAGNITCPTFTYSTDDMGFMNCRFNSATPITCNSGQTVRMDATSYSSFINSGSTWATNTPTIDFLSQSKGTGYTAISGNWTAPAPTTVQNAIDRMASLLKTLNGGNPIP